MEMNMSQCLGKSGHGVTLTLCGGLAWRIFNQCKCPTEFGLDDERRNVKHNSRYVCLMGAIKQGDTYGFTQSPGGSHSGRHRAAAAEWFGI